MQLHSRYFKVAEANNSLRLTYLKMEEKLDLTIDHVIGILLAIAVETNKVEDLKDRKHPIGLDEIGEEFYAELQKTEAQYELTQGESLKILLEAAVNENKYVIRQERHPEDPGRKGDEA